MDKLAEEHAHPRDAAIAFDEPSHVYAIAHDPRPYTSVTTLIGSVFAHFDGPAVAAKLAAKPDNHYKKAEYHGKSAAELVALWAAKGAAASEAGTAMHLDIERFYNGLPPVAEEEARAAGQPVPPRSFELQLFDRFWRNWQCGHLTPWRTEQRVYWEEYQLAGSIDMLFRDPETGELEIYDWKRVGKPLTPEHDNPRFPKFAVLPGLEHLVDNSYWHYALQLNLYKRILETKYGATVTNLCLIALHPDYPSYRRIVLPVMDDVLDVVLRHRLRTLRGEAAESAGGEHGDNEAGGGGGTKRRRDPSEDDEAEKKTTTTAADCFGDDE